MPSHETSVRPTVRRTMLLPLTWLSPFRAHCDCGRTRGGCCRLDGRVPDRHDGAGRVTNDLLGGTAEQELRQSAVTVRTHDDQVHRPSLGLLGYLGAWHALA